MLLGILKKLKQKKKDGEVVAENELSNWLDEISDSESIDLEALLQTESIDFKGFFEAYKGYNDANIELLADFLAELAKNPVVYSKEELQKKALDIYLYLDNSQKTFSFERSNKISELNSSLQSN